MKRFTYQVLNRGSDSFSFVNARLWEIDSYVAKNGTFMEKEARDNGMIFTHVKVDISVYDKFLS